jgi:hypothetical protein
MKVNRCHHMVSIAAMLAVTMMRVCAANAVSPVAGAQDAQSSAPAEAAAVSAGTAPAHSRAGPQGRAGLDERVALLTKELDLDAAQQAEVRRILMMQRMEIVQAWSDESQPAQVRVAATRVSGDRTAERIRTILNDTQREKYLKARPSLPDGGQPTDQVNTWINAVGGR